MAPRDVEEMRLMTRFALDYDAGPIAVRYPRGAAPTLEAAHEPIALGKAEVLREGFDVSIVAIGPAVAIALETADLLARRGQSVGVINARFVKPLDAPVILEAAQRANRVITIEDNVRDGGFGSAVLELLSDHNLARPVMRFGIPDQFVEHGPVAVLRKLAGITAEQIAATVSTQERGLAEALAAPAFD
jgi:1-deoxy-D-xylulose-5-phosphate synthase